jgi:hypothetical protein
VLLGTYHRLLDQCTKLSALTFLVRNTCVSALKTYICSYLHMSLAEVCNFSLTAVLQSGGSEIQAYHGTKPLPSQRFGSSLRKTK